MENMFVRLSNFFSVRKLMSLNEIITFFPIKLYLFLFFFILSATVVRSYEWQEAEPTDGLSSYCSVSLDKSKTPAAETIGADYLVVQNLVENLPDNFVSLQTNAKIVLKIYGDPKDNICDDLIKIRDEFVYAFNQKIRVYIAQKNEEIRVLKSFIISYFEATKAFQPPMDNPGRIEMPVEPGVFTADWEKIDSMFPRESHSITELFVRLIDAEKRLLQNQTFYVKNTDGLPTVVEKNSVAVSEVFSKRRLVLIFLSFLIITLTCLIVAAISVLKVKSE